MVILTIIIILLSLGVEWLRKRYKWVSFAAFCLMAVFLFLILPQMVDPNGAINIPLPGQNSFMISFAIVVAYIIARRAWSFYNFATGKVRSDTMSVFMDVTGQDMTGLERMAELAKLTLRRSLVWLSRS